jgi:murein DD-endopeptidase MepM/ murein hydrolase activator NlpD
MRFMALLISICLYSFAFNINISNTNIANGKTILLSFDKEMGIEYKDVEFDKKRFKIFQNPTDKKSLYALIPVSYYLQPTISKIKINYIKDMHRESKFLFLKIEDGKYEKEIIQVQSSKVNPKDKEIKKRISKEYAEAMKIYSTVTDESYIKSKFIMPINSMITSDFGKARIYNGSLKGYHSGTDFRAKVGTPIIASNDAKVVLVKDRFYSGGTVILDHGEGIYTCYFHMSKFSVKEGDIVMKGQELGLSGKSGRITGPHLHFSARINSVQVDPLQLITLLNNNLIKVPK